MSNFNIAIETVLKHEGGFINDSSDPGGATNYGISLRWLQSINNSDLDNNNSIAGFDRNKIVNVTDIKNLTRENAVDLYRTYWWDKYGYNKINNQALATKTFDLAINMGSYAAHRCLQRAIRAASGEKLKEDGILGQITLSLANQISTSILLAAYRSEAAGYYRSLNKPRFIEGWLNRAYS